VKDQSKKKMTDVRSRLKDLKKVCFTEFSTNFVFLHAQMQRDYLIIDTRVVILLQCQCVKGMSDDR